MHALFLGQANGSAKPVTTRLEHKKNKNNNAKDSPEPERDEASYLKWGPMGKICIIWRVENLYHLKDWQFLSFGRLKHFIIWMIENLNHLKDW